MSTRILVLYPRRLGESRELRWWLDEGRRECGKDVDCSKRRKEMMGPERRLAVTSSHPHTHTELHRTDAARSHIGRLEVGLRHVEDTTGYIPMHATFVTSPTCIWLKLEDFGRGESMHSGPRQTRWGPTLRETSREGTTTFYITRYVFLAAPIEGRDMPIPDGTHSTPHYISQRSQHNNACRPSMRCR